ncbi:MAG: hypothetical protein ACYDHG_05235 [Desulfomonilaceae bacterium]
MNTIEFIFQNGVEGTISEILSAMGRLASRATFTCLRASVAYASARGCRAFSDELSQRLPQWDTVRKEWLLSVDRGTTEPDALRSLMTMNDSYVRIHDGEAVLANNLWPRLSFHPKTYVFLMDPNQLDLGVGMLCGSANLTYPGLVTGVEHAALLSLLPPFAQNEREKLRQIERDLSWWAPSWNSASECNLDFLNRYQQLWARRPRVTGAEIIERMEGVADSPLDKNQNLSWADARCFWIEVGNLNPNLGRAGNQLDLQAGTRVYFGFSASAVDINHTFGSVRIAYGNRDPYDATLRFGHNGMDKLNLPIPGEYGPDSYENSFLHFERIREGHFVLTVSNGTEHQEWVRRSMEQGMSEHMRGGRTFGFYS